MSRYETDPAYLDETCCFDCGEDTLLNDSGLCFGCAHTRRNPVDHLALGYELALDLQPVTACKNPEQVRGWHQAQAQIEADADEDCSDDEGEE